MLVNTTCILLTVKKPSPVAEPVPSPPKSAGESVWSAPYSTASFILHLDQIQFIELKVFSLLTVIKNFKLTLTTNRKNYVFNILSNKYTNFVFEIFLSEYHFLARFHGDHFKVRLLANLSFNSQSLNLSKPLALLYL